MADGPSAAGRLRSSIRFLPGRTSRLSRLRAPVRCRRGSLPDCRGHGHAGRLPPGGAGSAEDVLETSSRRKKRRSLTPRDRFSESRRRRVCEPAHRISQRPAERLDNDALLPCQPFGCTVHACVVRLPASSGYRDLRVGPFLLRLGARMFARRRPRTTPVLDGRRLALPLSLRGPSFGSQAQRSDG